MEKISVAAAKQMSVLSLAFVGDAVFSLFIKESLTLKHDFKPGRLTLLSSFAVSAVLQCRMYDALIPVFTEDELSVAKSAKNSHTNNKAKNAALSEYKKATALEAVIGFLYLTGQPERLNEILNLCYGVFIDESNRKS